MIIIMIIIIVIIIIITIIIVITIIIIIIIIVIIIIIIISRSIVLWKQYVFKKKSSESIVFLTVIMYCIGESVWEEHIYIFDYYDNCVHESSLSSSLAAMTSSRDKRLLPTIHFLGPFELIPVYFRKSYPYLILHLPS